MSGEEDLEEGILMFVGGGGWFWRYSVLGAASLRLCTMRAQEKDVQATRIAEIYLQQKAPLEQRGSACHGRPEHGLAKIAVAGERLRLRASGPRVFLTASHASPPNCCAARLHAARPEPRNSGTSSCPCRRRSQKGAARTILAIRPTRIACRSYFRTPLVEVRRLLCWM